jgi:3-hydroxy-3-methylglutaryl CoA synthase
VILFTLRDSEYPTVDGHLSIGVYLTALENAYVSFVDKHKKMTGESLNYFNFDFFAMHTPFSKMV